MVYQVSALLVFSYYYKLVYDGGTDTRDGQGADDEGHVGRTAPWDRWAGQAGGQDGRCRRERNMATTLLRHHWRSRFSGHNLLLLIRIAAPCLVATTLPEHTIDQPMWTSNISYFQKHIVSIQVGFQYFEELSSTI